MKTYLIHIIHRSINGNSHSRIWYLALVVLLLCSSCDENFDELNTNQVLPTSINPIFQLNNAILSSGFGGNTLIYEMGIVQQIVSPNSGVITGANYNQDNRNATDNLWQGSYRNVIKNTRDILSQIEGDPERNNLRQMTRIWQARTFMVLTDTYGDIPYFEGGLGFTDQVVLPAYDPQEVIYEDIINELREASDALDIAGPTETADILYGGDVAQWRTLANSLLLRAGMRLTKVDPARAQQIAAEAFQKGVMTTNEGNAVIRHDNNFPNGIGSTLNGSEANNFFLVSSFVDYLQETNDPRLAAIAVRYVGAASGSGQTQDVADTDPTIQIGMPMGFDNSSIAPVAEGLGLASFYDFSQADRTRVTKQASPMFLVTASQTFLLLAEAVERGWVNGSAEEFYVQGVRAHMEQMVEFDPNSAVAPEAIDAYLAANPYNSAEALEQINTQYWVSSFLNGPEAFANFRRSGFPELTPNPFPLQDISGDFIRRLTYPTTEISVNAEQVRIAIDRMGPDVLDTRVWWDQ